MAEFSKEYYENEGINHFSDFSILEKFDSLSHGESSPEICEGFGITEILNINDECWVVCNNIKTKFSEFLSSKMK